MAEAVPSAGLIPNQLLRNSRKDVSGDIRVYRPPYKFLDYYEPSDADIFCGRDAEMQTVTRLVLSHRLVTVFGPSGAGKTSLLLAGILPCLMREGYQYVYVRTLDSPVTNIRKAVATHAGRTDWRKGANLRAFLEMMLAAGDRLMIMLDQMEELFLRLSSRERLGFFGELAAALEKPEREVRFVVCLREDHLACLDETRYCLPDIYTNSYRLTMLNPGSARLAIVEPATRAGVTVEPVLVDALVGSDGAAAASEKSDQAPSADHLVGDLVENDGYVRPAVLQIVLDRLYRQALPTGHLSDAPPPPDLTLTLEAYRHVHHQRGERWDAEQLWGAKAILASYVHERLARLPHLTREDGAPLGADPSLGAEILKVMVTNRDTKAALAQEEIVLLLDNAGIIQDTTSAQRALVKNTRLGLERVRLLRSFERDGAALYELAHDHLATEIATWISENEMQARLMRELLHRQMENWRHASLLIPLEVLQLIHDWRRNLGRLSRDKLELILHSALATGYEVAYWFERAREGGVQVTDIALARLEDPNFGIRVTAVTALGRIGGQFVEPVTRRLSDDYPQVRVAAITALENLQPDGAWRSHLTHECYVPAGEFLMGEGKGSHKVQVGAFYLGRFPVTNAEYKRFTDDIGRDFEVPAGKENHPVVNVSWFDARDYATWASMRLLTEAEWEKAASWDAERGKRYRYPWGNEFSNRRCNTEEMDIPGTTPVGRFSPQGDSPCGCADMAGNVWEWTGSLYRSYPYQADDGREDPDSPDVRVLRGGAFNNNAGFARTARRSRNYPDPHLWNLGFRVGFSATVHHPASSQRRDDPISTNPSDED
jgi:hypothetical protein